MVPVLGLHRDVLANLGRRVTEIVEHLGHGAVFSCFAVWNYFRGKHLGTKMLRAIWVSGVRCVPVVSFVGLFTGLVLGLLGADTLERFGATSLLGSAVVLSLMRELAPVLTGLVVVGQAGSALCSELGIYRQDDQVNALEMMGISANGYLVGAPLLASAVTFPILTAFFAMTGLVGGFFSGVRIRGVDEGVYWHGVREALEMSDIRMGLGKGLVFGVVTMAICAYSGFFSHRLTPEKGARAVSTMTTRAVIMSSVAILILDYVITAVSLTN